MNIKDRRELRRALVLALARAGVPILPVNGSGQARAMFLVDMANDIIERIEHSEAQDMKNR